MFPYKDKNNYVAYDLIFALCTAKKVSVFGVFVVRIFPHSNWMRRGTEYADQKNSKYGQFSRTDENLFDCSNAWHNKIINK